MELIFQMPVTPVPADVDAKGLLKLSSLLYYAQEAAGGHCKLLGFDWDSMDAKGMFWAVLRHRVVIHRLPRLREQFTVETWPMPATRVAYPRMVQATDSNGQLLWQVISLWVLMDKEKRTMILPGKSGVQVPGILRELELEPPVSLPPVTAEQSVLWEVCQEDLDVNGHVNNAKYLDKIQLLAPSGTPKEAVVCYLAETRLHQQLQLHWELTSDGVLQVDGCRERTDVHGKPERVFAARLIY